MKALKTLFISLFLLACVSPLGWARKPTLESRIAAAGSVCFAPLLPAPYEAALRADLSKISGDDDLKEEVAVRGPLLSVSEISEFGTRAHNRVSEILGREVSGASEEIFETKTRSGKTYYRLNFKKLNCDFYAALEWEEPGEAREALFHLDKRDAQKEEIALPASSPALRLSLYEKTWSSGGGRDRVSAEAVLVGAAGDAADRFPWLKSRYQSDADALKKDFNAHAEALRARVLQRLEGLLPAFEKEYKKKRKKR